MGPLIMAILCGEGVLASIEYRSEDIWLDKPSIGVGAAGWYMKLGVASANV